MAPLAAVYCAVASIQVGVIGVGGGLAVEAFRVSPEVTLKQARMGQEFI